MKAAHRLLTGWPALLLLLPPVLGVGAAHEGHARTVAAVTAPMNHAPTAGRRTGAVTDSDTPWGP
ncbi:MULTISPECIES: hypothetical protein [unclassified Streptomyces]|uniref:hypothetical protein n=1 Tax=unclassified Streptomyces TaxID=2593676 RepID=UPI0033EC9068